MYIIGHIILGTHAPWVQDEPFEIAAAYARADLQRLGPHAFLQGILSEDEVNALSPQEADEILQDVCETGADYEWWRVHRDIWDHEYHGGADQAPRWCGVEVGQIDETDHVPLTLSNGEGLIATYTPEQLNEARRRYDSLPEEVRVACPPFGMYIVWGSS